MPRKMCSSSLQQLVSLLDICTVCPCHPDQKFIEMVESKKGRLMAKNGLDVVARVNGFSPVTLNGKRYNKTIRISTCEMLVHGGKCVSCVSYCDSLRPIYHRWKKQKSLSPSHQQSTESKTNIRWLSTPDKAKRYSKLRNILDAKLKTM